MARGQTRDLCNGGRHSIVTSSTARAYSTGLWHGVRPVISATAAGPSFVTAAGLRDDTARRPVPTGLYADPAATCVVRSARPGQPPPTVPGVRSPRRVRTAARGIRVALSP